VKTENERIVHRTVVILEAECEALQQQMLAISQGVDKKLELVQTKSVKALALKTQQIGILREIQELDRKREQNLTEQHHCHRKILAKQAQLHQQIFDLVKCLQHDISAHTVQDVQYARNTTFAENIVHIEELARAYKAELSDLENKLHILEHENVNLTISLDQFQSDFITEVRSNNCGGGGGGGGGGAGSGGFGGSVGGGINGSTNGFHSILGGGGGGGGGSGNGSGGGDIGGRGGGGVQDNHGNSSTLRADIKPPLPLPLPPPPPSPDDNSDAVSGINNQDEAEVTDYMRAYCAGLTIDFMHFYAIERKPGFEYTLSCICDNQEQSQKWNEALRHIPQKQQNADLVRFSAEDYASIKFCLNCTTIQDKTKRRTKRI